MGLIKSFITDRIESRKTTLGDLSDRRTSSGVAVTPQSAMRTSAVWACMRVLSFSLASLPLHIYVDLPGGGREKAINLPAYNLLHSTPNREISSFTFRKVGMAQLCLYGNAYAEIEPDNFGYPKALWPLPAWCVEPLKTRAGDLFYRITMPDTGEQKNLQADRVLHVMGLGTDGLQGLSPIRQHAETIGISIAAEKFGGAFFGKGMNVGAVVEHPKVLSDSGSKHLRESLEEKYSGLGNASRLLLLEEGMKFQKAGIPPNEAQFLETRQFQVEDIARIYGVQLHKIGHLLHATFSNIEHQAIEFVTDTMLPWVVNWEQEYDRKLLDNRHYTKHSLEGLLRGDSAARGAFYRELFNLSSISPDEIREKEDMNPEPDGQGNRYYIMGNMVPVDKIDEYLEKKVAGNLPGPAEVKPAAPSKQDILKRIAEREKADILRASRKNPKGLDAWLTDFYRDFPEYIKAQLEPALGNNAAGYALQYIEKSKRELQTFDPEDIEKQMEDWVERRLSEKV